MVKQLFSVAVTQGLDHAALHVGWGCHVRQYRLRTIAVSGRAWPKHESGGRRGIQSLDVGGTQFNFASGKNWYRIKTGITSGRRIGCGGSSLHYRRTIIVGTG